jgi:hypothetical protein
MSAVRQIQHVWSADVVASNLSQNYKTQNDKKLINAIYDTGND